MKAGFPIALSLIVLLSCIVAPFSLACAMLSDDHLTTVVSSALLFITSAYHAACITRTWLQRTRAFDGEECKAAPSPAAECGYSSMSGIVISYVLACCWLLDLGFSSHGHKPTGHDAKQFQVAGYAMLGLEVISLVVLAIYSTSRRRKGNKQAEEEAIEEYYMGKNAQVLLPDAKLGASDLISIPL